MAKADDMANAKPMYLDAMESANGISRWARLSCPLPKKKKRRLFQAETYLSSIMLSEWSLG